MHKFILNRPLILTPKVHSEWIFIPNEQNLAKDLDVGLFLNHGEILYLIADTKPVTKGQKYIISISIGLIVINQNEWQLWTKPLSDAVRIFDEEKILYEYLND